jgi:hypothetical protein
MWNAYKFAIKRGYIKPPESSADRQQKPSRLEKAVETTGIIVTISLLIFYFAFNIKVTGSFLGISVIDGAFSGLLLFTIFIAVVYIRVRKKII